MNHHSPNPHQRAFQGMRLLGVGLWGSSKDGWKIKLPRVFPQQNSQKLFLIHKKTEKMVSFSSEENSGKDAKKQPQQKRKRATSAVHPMLKKCLIIKIKIKDTLSFYRSAFRWRYGPVVHVYISLPAPIPPKKNGDAWPRHPIIDV